MTPLRPIKGGAYATYVRIYRAINRRGPLHYNTLLRSRKCFFPRCLLSRYMCLNLWPVVAKFGFFHGNHLSCSHFALSHSFDGPLEVFLRPGQVHSRLVGVRVAMLRCGTRAAPGRVFVLLPLFEVFPCGLALIGSALSLLCFT